MLFERHQQQISQISPIGMRCSVERMATASNHLTMSTEHNTRRTFAKTLAVGAGARSSRAAPRRCRTLGAARRRSRRRPAGTWSPASSRASSRRHSPRATFDVTRHGAVGDGRTDCTAAFRAAIDACSAAGGGRVVVPAGRFLTGPIHLEEQRQPARDEGRDDRVQHGPARVPARGVHALGGDGADGLLAAHLRLRAGRTSPSPARARSTGRRRESNWWRGRAGASRRATPNQDAGAQPAHARWWRRGMPVARARVRRRELSCARSSSSRTAAGTS